MVAYTTAIGLSEVANSSFVGTWDVPTNNNWIIADTVMGGVATIALNNSPVTLTVTQLQCSQIIFNSTLTGSVAITFPLGNPSSSPVSAVTKPYIIQNLCTGTSAFIITLQTTVAGGQVVACKPGDPFDVINDGTNIKFKNLGHVGSYWDYAGSSVPSWVTGCTVPPYLNCDGTSFSSATYPALATILGGTTLPDSRGRFRAALNQGQSRITSGSSTGGLDGNTAYSGGGSQTTTLSSQNVPPVPITDPGHTHTISSATAVLRLAGVSLAIAGAGNTTTTDLTNAINTAVTNITAGSATPTNFSNIPPAYIGGLTMIRSA